jgi:prepilin-type N-terminal cleavage/methylation domain-containing protein
MDNKQDKGFTLVELLIVIVILGILATVTVFAVRGITDQGTASACAADLKTNQVAIETYYAKFGTTAGAPDTADLVSAGFMVANSSPKYTVTGGVISATTAGGCPAP